MTNVTYPQASDYRIAFQHPKRFFRDPELQAARASTDGLGLPLLFSGGAAVACRMERGTSTLAVRCFRREIPDREARYAAISKAIVALKSPYFAGFNYMPDAVLVNGLHYPIIKMAWVDGQTLGNYINLHHGDRVRMEQLLARFRTAIQALTAHGIAHGDIQHGNIMVTDSRLVFIDYDDMYVPGIPASSANTVGHPHYQLPSRSERDFSPAIDRFPSIVIALALRSLALRPDLWARFPPGGENILFTKADFLNPDASELLRDLRKVPELTAQVDRFKLLCRTPLNQLPTLEQFLDGTPMAAAPRAAKSVPNVARTRPFDVIEATATEQLRFREGDLVEVVGRIRDVTVRYTTAENPYAFVNFADWRQGTFRLILWNEALREFEAAGTPIKSFVDKWVSVTGVLYVWKERNSAPQIQIGHPRELRVLSGYAEAQRILNEDAVANSPATDHIPKGAAAPPATPSQISGNQAILHNLRSRVGEQKPNSSPTRQRQPPQIRSTVTPASQPAPGSPFAEFRTEPPFVRLDAYREYVMFHDDRNRAIERVISALTICREFSYPMLSADQRYRAQMDQAKTTAERRRVFATWVVDWQRSFEQYGSVQPWTRSVSGAASGTRASSPQATVSGPPSPQSGTVPGRSYRTKPPQPGSPFARMVTEPRAAAQQSYEAYLRHKSDEATAAQKVADELRGTTVTFDRLLGDPGFLAEVGRNPGPDRRREVFARWLVRWQRHWERTGKLPASWSRRDQVILGVSLAGFVGLFGVLWIFA